MPSKERSTCWYRSLQISALETPYRLCGVRIEACVPLKMLAEPSRYSLLTFIHILVDRNEPQFSLRNPKTGADVKYLVRFR
jgi:hypothetical protein